MSRLLVLFAAAAVLALLILPAAMPSSQFIMTIAIAKGFAALGVALLLRGGLISIGHAMYFAIGAYATAFMMKFGVLADLALLLIGSTLVTAVCGLVFGTFLVRFRAIFFAMLNLAVSMVLFALLSKLYGLTGGTDGMRVATPAVFGLELDKAAFDDILYYVCVGLLVAIGLLIRAYLKSPLGYALMSIHTNEIRLEYLGVSAWSVTLIAYTISAALAGLGGAMAALTIGHVLPEYAYWTESGHLVLTAVLGGIGGVAGPFIGSVFLEAVHVLAVDVAADAWNMILGAALLAVIFFLPHGLHGLLEKRAEPRKSQGVVE
ncbi:branched-chain amino acid ABC transporter permease [Pseudohoeflea coraliihabitans]|uniref:Branched-chain amino acid ABC transporter permease n=1 Tax=Pseudohoeflea coraliihabitans TaxID=2860393 RepID=A0ABS6WRX0_9HYPH|nr:branched-chain amino acid ABC transporter permease [Pseudohoeflea sp. DP4N28-3]MBW3098157.1 branched-chain amino acid ABC transporter permease [Pseudohoeflea sp. DP4N28-3]